jgi:hypothetical protein
VISSHKVQLRYNYCMSSYGHVWISNVFTYRMHPQHLTNHLTTSHLN